MFLFFDLVHSDNIFNLTEGFINDKLVERYNLNGLDLK